MIIGKYSPQKIVLKGPYGVGPTYAGNPPHGSELRPSVIFWQNMDNENSETENKKRKSSITTITLCPAHTPMTQ